jgi:DNA ligase-associated metallophosphoesterase
VNAPWRRVRYEVADRPCGSVRTLVAGAEVVLRPSGALWLEAAATLVVADLHFEKGSAYAARGQMLPPYDTADTLNRLEGEVRALAPRVVVLLGDTLHDRHAETRIAACDAEQLGALAAGRTLVWVVGNHDADGPRWLPGEIAAEIAVAGLCLRHEPQPGAQRGETAGHLHPCARVSARGRSVRRRCFITDGERLILPAFGAFAGGLNVRDQAFRELFTHAPLTVALGSRRAHAVSWSALVGD